MALDRYEQSFAVIGCGRFGGAVVEELAAQGADVMAIDSNEETIKKYVSIASEAIILDSTDEEALRSIGIRNIDHAIVGIGNFQASVLTVLLLKELGIKKVTVKVVNDYHKKVILKIGADAIIQPEKDTGRRLAHQIVSDFVVDCFFLSDNYSLIELLAMGPVLGKTLVELNLPKLFGINIAAIKRLDQIVVPQAGLEIRKGDILLVVGKNDDIARFEHWLAK